MQGQLRQLILRKDQIEQQIKKLAQKIDLLDQTKDLGGKLVDQEGFPRNDLDFGQLVEYRNLKRRRAELNNDHSALMKQIERGLVNLHATYPKTAQSQTTNEKGNIPSFKKPTIKQGVSKKQEYKIDYLTPFAKISLVEPQSPAALSGIEVGDLLSEFGEVTIYTMDNIKSIPGQVREGKPVRVVLMRNLGEDQSKQYEKIFQIRGNNYAKVELKVTPSRWSGRGLLGCKIDPL